MGKGTFKVSLSFGIFSSWDAGGECYSRRGLKSDVALAASSIGNGGGGGGGGFSLSFCVCVLCCV